MVPTPYGFTLSQAVNCQSPDYELHLEIMAFQGLQAETDLTVKNAGIVFK